MHKKLHVDKRWIIHRIKTIVDTIISCGDLNTLSEIVFAQRSSKEPKPQYMRVNAASSFHCARFSYNETTRCPLKVSKPPRLDSCMDRVMPAMLYEAL